MDSLPVIYADETIAVVYKPEKLLTHRTEIANGDTEFALQIVRNQLGRRVSPVYRLDRGTSGLLMFAFDSEVVSALAGQTHESFKKRYLALVRGWTPEELEINHALKPPVDPYLRTQKTQPQSAVSYLKTIAQTEIPVPSGTFPSTRLSLVSLELGTGRRHQLRRHLKHIAHPIIGDATYGKGPLNRALADYFDADRLLLHCGQISFVHPKTAERLTLTCEPMGVMYQMLSDLGWVQKVQMVYKTAWHQFDF